MTVSGVICILLVDDQPVLRLGLRVVLERASDIDVVGEADNGEEALALINTLGPDVVMRAVGGAALSACCVP